MLAFEQLLRDREIREAELCRDTELAQTEEVLTNVLGKLTPEVRGSV